jgi:DNA-directed RNA polymerase sigma subunit (sigma70/sigma32)
LVRGWYEVFIRAPKKFGGVLLGQIGSSASYLLLDHKYAGLFGISPSTVSQLKTVSIRPASLDAPISDEDSAEFGETVGDEDAQTPFELLRDKNLRDEVSDLFEVLDDRERTIIFQRFGLGGGKPRTLEELGKKFSVDARKCRRCRNSIASPALLESLEEIGVLF